MRTGRPVPAVERISGASGPTAFGPLLRRLRIAAELTQEALAERAGLGTRSIQALEGSAHQPHRETVQRLVEVLGLVGAERLRFESAGHPAPRLRQLAAHAGHNLPAQPTTFIGRERELNDVAERLTTTRLFTLTGSGGCGKSRLALEVASRLLNRYPDGVWLVELASLAEPVLVPQAIARVLSVPEQAGQTMLATLLNALSGKHLLLILDNCEHLIGACAHTIDAILRACPAIQVLATSREPVRIAGESMWRVPSLAVPNPDRLPACDQIATLGAVGLFVDRVQAAQPAFSLTEQNVAAVAQICWRLGGIPLALELAAARGTALSVADIALRMDDRFQLLTGGSRTALPRHQTLRATLEWGYDLLSEPERRLLNRLAVFAGALPLEAVEVVCSDCAAADATIFDSLVQLVEKSFVTADIQGTLTEYRLLETVRAFAWEQLATSGEGEMMRNRHASYYLALAQAAEQHFEKSDAASWLNRLEHECDNVRAALRWYEESGEVESGFELAGALRLFWQMRGYLAEAREWLGRFLVAPGGMHSSASRAKALRASALLAECQGDEAAYRQLMSESLAIRRELGDSLAIADSLVFGAEVHLRAGNHAEGRVLLDESIAVNRTLENWEGVATAVSWLGRIALEGGDILAALSYQRERLKLYRQVGDRQGEAWALVELGTTALRQDDIPAASAYLVEGLIVSQELEYKWGMFHALGGLAHVAAAQGQAERAQRLAGAAFALKDAIGASSGYLTEPDLDSRHGSPPLSEQALAIAWADGQRMTLEQAIAEGLSARR
jgi:predicted ATPase